MEIQEFDKIYETVCKETDESFRLLGEGFIEDGEAMMMKSIGMGELEEARHIYRKIADVKRIFGKYYEFEDNAISEDRLMAEIFSSDADLTFDMPLTKEKFARLSAVSAKFPLSLTSFKLAGLLLKAGIAADKDGNTAAAAEMYEKSAEMYENSYDDEFETPPQILSPLWNLALLYEASGKPDKAVPYMDKGIAYSKRFAKFYDIYGTWLKEFQQMKDEILQNGCISKN